MKNIAQACFSSRRSIQEKSSTTLAKTLTEKSKVLKRIAKNLQSPSAENSQLRQYMIKRILRS